MKAFTNVKLNEKMKMENRFKISCLYNFHLENQVKYRKIINVLIKAMQQNIITG